MSTPTALTVAALTEREHFDEAVRLQEEIWGFEPAELIPVRIFAVASKIGGQAFGAYDGADMVGFCLAFPGIKSGPTPYLHSQMLGVRKEYRNAGVGRILKLRQREDGLSRGIQLMEWTFDPLEIKNAYFNIERLGCVIRRYLVNVYGTTTSHLHGGLPTDRCVPEWWFSSVRVHAILAGVAHDRPPIEARISVPVAIETLRKTDSAAALEIQANVTQQFQQHFGGGLAVVGFERTADAGSYLLGRLPS